MNFHIASPITRKAMHLLVRSSQSMKIETKLDGNDRQCPQNKSLGEFFAQNIQPLWVD
jgi:hypothetical protein